MNWIEALRTKTVTGSEWIPDTVSALVNQISFPAAILCPPKLKGIVTTFDGVDAALAGAGEAALAGRAISFTVGGKVAGALLGAVALSVVRFLGFPAAPAVPASCFLRDKPYGASRGCAGCRWVRAGATALALPGNSTGSVVAGNAELKSSASACLMAPLAQ